MVGLLAPSTGGSVHLEGPQEVGGIPVVRKGKILLVLTRCIVDTKLLYEVLTEPRTIVTWLYDNLSALLEKPPSIDLLDEGTMKSF